MGGIVFILALALAASLLALWWCVRWGTPLSSRGPLALALVALGLAVVGVWMLPHHFASGVQGHASGFNPGILGVVAVVIAVQARRRKGSDPIPSRRLMVIFGFVIALHVTVIGSLMALRHFHLI